MVVAQRRGLAWYGASDVGIWSERAGATVWRLNKLDQRSGYPLSEK